MQTLRSFILLSFFICMATHASSQNCPPNIDFEYGSFSNWELYTGTCCPISTPVLSGAVTNRHTITSGAATDPYGGFPIVAPNGGSFSLKLGNNSVGAQAERARYYVHVPAGKGKYILVFRYAVVLQNPNHAAAQQPRFEVKAYDSATNDPVTCAQFSYVSSSSLPGFKKSAMGSDVYYKEWTTASLDLTKYPGRTVALDFASGDCSQSGHFGYGYIDMNCGLFQIYSLQCNASAKINLNGPPGFQYYTWMDSAMTTTYGTKQNIVISKPAKPTTYALILRPYTGYGCPDTLYTTYKASALTVTRSLDTSTCMGKQVQLHIKGSSFIDTPYSYYWYPATGLSCTNCTDPIVNTLSSQTYYAVISNNVGCTDTEAIRVTIDTLLFSKITKPADSICQNQTVSLSTSGGTNPSTSIYTWNLDGGTISAGTDKSKQVTWATSGLKKAVLTVSDNGCIGADTATIYVKPQIALTVSKDTVICTGTTAQLIANATNSPSSPFYTWSPTTGLSCSNCNNPTASPGSTTIYTVTASVGKACPISKLVKVKTDSGAVAIIKIPTDTLCENKDVLIQNVAVNPSTTSYSWNVSPGDIISGAGTKSIIVQWHEKGPHKIVLKTINGFCSAADSVNINIHPNPLATFNINPNACIGDLVKITTQQQNTIYHWTLDEASIADTIFRNAYYVSWRSSGRKNISLEFDNSHGCKTKYDTSIMVHELPESRILSAGEGQICYGDMITLQAKEGAYFTYQWLPASVFKNNNSAEVSAVFDRAMFVFLTVTDQWGCHISDTSYIDAENCCAVYFPNVFTPNGDNNNDKFHILSPALQHVKAFVIKNRWGQTVFESIDASSGWDGTLNGEPQDSGTYYYYLQYSCDNKTVEKRGDVILLR